MGSALATKPEAKKRTGESRSQSPSEHPQGAGASAGLPLFLGGSGGGGRSDEAKRVQAKLETGPTDDPKKRHADRWLRTSESAPGVGLTAREAAPPVQAAPPLATPPAIAVPVSAETSTATPAAADAPPGTKDHAGKPEKPTPAAGAEHGGAAAHAAADGVAAPVGPGVEIQLQMPEPATGLSPGTKKRISHVHAAAGQNAATHATLPPAQTTVGEARAAVTEPPQETKAHAQEKLVTALGKRPKPSPEIELLCFRIFWIIRSKRPPDEDSLVDADPEAMGKAAGGELNETVQCDTQRVAGNYNPLQKNPQGTPQQIGQGMNPPPETVTGAPIHATQATPDAVPAKDVSLDADVENSQKRMDDAGMNSEPAKLAQTGPVAEAREAHGELEKTAKEDPAKVLAAQKESLNKASCDMAALQQSALQALTSSRKSTVGQSTGHQKEMVGTEAQKRATASAEAQRIFKDAQTQVQKLLNPLPRTAMERWNTGVAVASEKFKQHLKKVEGWIKERHSGMGGKILGALDWATGLPGWVTDEYDDAEKKFGDDVCQLVREISIEVNSVIMACEGIIEGARGDISGVFSRLGPDLQQWAAGEQNQFQTQLDALHKHALQTRDNFNKELISKASQSVQEVREQIHELREAAKGLIGRIADAIGRFLKDPVKFIVEALLSLLGIPAAAFWAVVAKIKKVVKDIANDPLAFASNLMAAVGQGFSQFFDHILNHLLKGFINWLTGGLAAAGVQIPQDLSVRSIITFFLQLMGITWPRVRKLLVKHVGEKNVALIEKVWSIITNLIALGPEGVFDLIKERLNPGEILNQVINAAVDYMMKAVVKAVAARILMLFNPVGAILQALEAIYRVLKWVFVNAARIFHLVEVIVDGIADIIAGNIGGMALAIENALAGLIPPVIDFLADYLGFGDLPQTISSTIVGFQGWVEGRLESVIVWLVEKGKALLTTVGLGGDSNEKEKGTSDGEVGETVNFTAGEEQHKLWVAVEGNTPILMVASGKAAVLDFLESKRVTDAAKDDKQLKATVESAKKLAGSARVSADKVLVAMSNSKKDEAAGTTTENQKVKSAEEQLAELLGEILDAIPKDGLSIFDVIGESIDDQPAKAPVGYNYAMLHGFREIRRASGRAEGRRQYPQVHVEEDTRIQTGTGIQRYDYDLIKRYKAAISKADLDADEAPGNADIPVNALFSGANKEEYYNEGTRAQMEQIILEIEGGSNVTGVEVQLGKKRRIDYTLQIRTRSGMESVLVEYKHWTGHLSPKRRATLAAKLQTQLLAYVDLARTGGNNYKHLIIKWPRFHDLDNASQDEFMDVIYLVESYNMQKPAKERVTIERPDERTTDD